MSVSPGEMAKYRRYLSKCAQNDRKQLPFDEWAERYRRKVRDGLVRSAKPESVSDDTWERYNQFRSHCRTRGFEIPTVFEYEMNHMGRKGKRDNWIPPLERIAVNPFRARRVANPICKADIAAIVERNQKIVEEKLGIKLRRSA